MVHLHKKREEPKFSFEVGSDEEGTAVFSDGSRFESEVATRDTVGNLVAQYGRCRELFVQIAHLAQELAHYAGPLGTDGGETVGETLKELMRQKPTRRAQELSLIHISSTASLTRTTRTAERTRCWPARAWRCV